MTPEKITETKLIIDSDQEILAEEHPQAELLRWHHVLGHLTFSNIRS